MRSFATIILAAVCVMALAQKPAPGIGRVPGGPAKRLTIALSTNQPRTPGPITLYDNNNISTGFYYYDPPNYAADDLHMTAGGIINGFSFGYYDPPTDGAVTSAVISFWNNDPADDPPTGPIRTFTVGVPANGAYIVTVDLSGGFEFTAPKDIWMSVQWPGSDAGWLIFGPPSVGATHDLFYRFPGGGYFFFGGSPKANFCAAIFGAPFGPCPPCDYNSTFNQLGDHETDAFGWYYAVVGGVFPPGHTLNGDNASGGTMRYLLDDSIWGAYPLDTWNKDDWFSDNSSLALTLKNGPSIVYDNNGLETATYPPGFYTAPNHGAYIGYSMSNNFDWIYSGWLILTAPTTFDQLNGYFDERGIGPAFGVPAFNPYSPNIRYRMNIWSKVTGDLLPFNTGSFVGDVLTSDMGYASSRTGAFSWSDTGVDRVGSSLTSNIFRLKYKLDSPVTLPAGQYYFSHDAVIVECDMPVDLSGTYCSPSGVSAVGRCDATTDPAGVTYAPGQKVYEESGSLLAQDATYTPFSDGLKPPVSLTADMDEQCYDYDVDLHELSKWNTGLTTNYFTGEYFTVGLGRNVRWTTAQGPEVWTTFWRPQGQPGFRIELMSAVPTAPPASYLYYQAPADESRFRICVCINGGLIAAQITALNGAGAGLSHIIGPMPLDGADDVSNTGFFAGFRSYSLENKALATISGLSTWAKPNALYLYCDDPYVKPGETAYYRMGMAALDQPTWGYQAFLSNSNPALQTLSFRAYTGWPFPTKNIPTITDPPLAMSAGVFGSLASPVQRNTTLVTLDYTTIGQGIGSLDFRSNNPPTRFSDANGNPINPYTQNSNLVLSDGVAPSLSIVSAKQGVTNIIGGTAIQGQVDITVSAADLGVGIPNIGSGLACRPVIKIDFSPPGPGPEDVTLDTFSGPDNQFMAKYTIVPTTPCGPATITATATDNAGNSASQSASFNVNTAQITVNLSLTLVGATIQRGIEFTVGGTSGLNPPITFCKNVNFVSGAAMVVLNAFDGILCGAAFTRIGAKDTLHTLNRTVALVPLGNSQFTAAMALAGGDANNDNLIDILDYGVFAFKYGTNYGTGDTPCGTLPPHPDFSGNGIVGTEDYTFIATQFLAIGDASPGNYGPIGTPKTTATIAEIVKAGVPRMIALQFDANKDGIVTMREIADWLAHQPKPREIQH